MLAKFPRSALAALALIFCSLPAMAQGIIRGEIAKIDGSVLTIKTRGGQDVTVRLAEGAAVAVVEKATLADIKPDAWVGAAALPQADGTLKALEVHIFPASMRGVGAGTRAFDLEPGSTMTNGAISGSVAGTHGPALTISYPDGNKTVVVPPNVPIVSLAPGSAADLKLGAGIDVYGAAKAADGVLEAKRVTVGKDGVNPPM